MSKPFAFAGLDLTTGNYRVLSTNAFSNPEREIKAIELARADGSEAVFKRYKERAITLDGLIKGTSSSDVETTLDTLKTYLNRSGPLDIGYKSGIRRWQCEMQNFIVSREATDINQMAVSYSFYSKKPYSVDTTSANLASTTITAATNSISVTGQGSYPSLPIYTLTINAISATSTILNLVISNHTESRYLTITRSNPVAGDVIVINCLDSSVTYNGIAMRARGRFPIFAPGSGTLGISDDAVSRNISVDAPYDLRFL